jgi:hypothetical protein
VLSRLGRQPCGAKSGDNVSKIESPNDLSFFEMDR